LLDIREDIDLSICLDDCDEEQAHAGGAQVEHARRHAFVMGLQGTRRSRPAPLLSLIGSHPNGEVCACELVTPLGLSQPTVSHHLKILHEAGLLEREKRGTWVYYRVSEDRLDSLAGLLSAAD
jgi:DNA-binding transcriptional ArsR family regulator